MITCAPATATTTTTSIESAYTKALLRSLRSQGIQFLRYVTVDPYNTIRAKAVPIHHLLKQNKQDVSLHRQCSIAAVCHGGLPSYADLTLEGTGLSACNVLSVYADPETIRVLPYNQKSAIVMGTLHNQYDDQVSPYCTRSLLAKLVQDAAAQHNVAFNVGAELEFCLWKEQTNAFVDTSIFANTTTLNEQENFISTLYEQCHQQDISIELIHAESAGGQLEVVLQYLPDPVQLCDTIVLTKETIQAVARQYGMKALFLPKFDKNQAGNGMHLHMSIRDATTGQPLLGNGSALSEQGAAFIEGILQHLPAITGLTLPTVNSHRRIGKGCWTGSEVGWAVEDKETCVRVCSNLQTKEWDHVEFKLVDSSANPYLAVGALLHSGLSGMVQKLTLRPSLHEISDKSKVPSVPNTLGDALDALEADTKLCETFLGKELSKSYLVVRRHELERSLNKTLKDELQEALA